MAGLGKSLLIGQHTDTFGFAQRNMEYVLLSRSSIMESLKWFK